MNEMNEMNNKSDTTSDIQENPTPQPHPEAAPRTTKFCKHCGEKIDIDSIICEVCGKQVAEVKTKFCKFCGEKIDIDAVICIKCGKQVEELRISGGFEQPKIEVNVNQNQDQSSANTNSNVNENINTNMMMNAHMFRRPKDKWVAFLLCLFIGYWGVHKFYEGKVGMGIFYIFTFGLFGIGILVDLIVLLCKPNPYYI